MIPNIVSQLDKDEMHKFIYCNSWFKWVDNGCLHLCSGPNRLSPPLLWGNSVRIKSLPLCSPLKTGTTTFYFCISQNDLFYLGHDALVCLSQVHQLFCWPSLGYNKDEQLTSVPASGLYSSFAKLPVRRRYNISFAWIHNLTNNTNRQTYMHSANALFQQSSFCQTFHNILGILALNMFNPLFHKEKGSADFVGAYQTCKYCTVLVIASSYIPLQFAGYAPFLKIYQSLQLVYSSRK